MFFAWAYEMTPEGLKKEKDVDRSQSMTTVTGQKLNNAIIGVLVTCAGLFRHRQVCARSEARCGVDEFHTIRTYTGSGFRAGQLR